MSAPQEIANTRSEMVSIPPEILEAVADEVQPSDLLALRLVSREVCNATDRPFVREYFTSRNHLLTVKSLEDLVHITATPRLCKKLERLTFSLAWLSTGRCKDDPNRACMFPCPCRDGPDRACSYPCSSELHESNSRHRVHCSLWAAWSQAKVQLEERMGALLEKALSNIATTHRKSLLYLTLLECFDQRAGGRWRARVHGKTSFDRYLGAPMEVPDGGSTPLWQPPNMISGSSLTRVLLCAVAGSRIPLQELALPQDFFLNSTNREAEFHTNEYPDWFSDLHPKISSSFTQVHTIQLGDHIHRWLPPISNPNMQDIVTDWFPRLTSVSITSHMDVHRLIAAFPSGNFKKIEIKEAHYKFQYDQMVLFLTHHRSSLVHVSLSRIRAVSICERSQHKLHDFIHRISVTFDLHTFELNGFKIGLTNIWEPMQFTWHSREEVSTFLESDYLATEPIVPSALVE